ATQFTAAIEAMAPRAASAGRTAANGSGAMRVLLSSALMDAFGASCASAVLMRRFLGPRRTIRRNRQVIRDGKSSYTMAPLTIAEERHTQRKKGGPGWGPPMA